MPAEQTKLWIMAPRADQGAKMEDEIYAAVGAALSAWEGVEEGLAEIFALFVGAPEAGPASGHEPAIRAYGAVNSFSSRLDMVSAAADCFFYRASDDDATRKRFGHLMKSARGFSARRNDIAHGRIRHIPHKGFYLLPGLYSSRKNPVDDPAIYAYNATQIHQYRECFAMLEQEFTDYAIFASTWGPPIASAGRP